MWLDNNKLEVTDFIGFSDEVAYSYHYSLSDEERAIFRESYIAFYRACLHIAVTGRASGLSEREVAILSNWLRSTTTSVQIRVQCRLIYFVIARVADGIQVVNIGKYSYL
jgi:hypothetical protein